MKEEITKVKIPIVIILPVHVEVFSVLSRVKVNGNRKISIKSRRRQRNMKKHSSFMKLGNKNQFVKRIRNLRYSSRKNINILFFEFIF